MALAINAIDGHDLSNEMQLQLKETKVTLLAVNITVKGIHLLVLC